MSSEDTPKTPKTPGTPETAGTPEPEEDAGRPESSTEDAVPETPADDNRRTTVEHRRTVDLFHHRRHRARHAQETAVPPLVPAPEPVSEPKEESVREAVLEAAQEATTEDAGGPPAALSESAPPPPTGRSRLVKAFWPPRLSRGQVVVAVLLFALGAGLAIQVRSNTQSDPLRGARESDLVRVLDELNERTSRLEEEKHRLSTSRDQLRGSNDRAEEARTQTEQKAAALGVLAGTVKAEGPGITLTVTGGNVRADALLDALQELRNAGAEAIQINQVRVVAGTWFADGSTPGKTVIDGQETTSPYVFKVIGNPLDLEPALKIPGGVVSTLQNKQAQVLITPSQQVVVDALRPAQTPDYARSAPGGGGG